MSNDAIDKAIAAAAEANKNKQAEQPQSTAVAQPSNTAAQAYVAPRLKTFDDLNSGGLNVDEFIKVDEHGFQSKKPDRKGLVPKIKVAIDTRNGVGIQVFEGAVYGTNPYTYIKTYDGVREAKGGLWQEALNKAMIVNPQLRTYHAADISMTVLEDTLGHTGTKVFDKGANIGYSTPVTNKALLKSFLADVEKLSLTDKVVDVEIVAIPKSNAKGTWGVVEFKVLGEHNPAEEQAA